MYSDFREHILYSCHFRCHEIGIECDDQTCLNLIRQFDTNGDDKLHLLEWEVLCKALLGQDHIDRLIRNQCKIETATPNYPPNHHLKYGNLKCFDQKVIHLESQTL